MKYNLSEIMKNAWAMRKNSIRSAGKTLSFSECLKRAWSEYKNRLYGMRTEMVDFDEVKVFFSGETYELYTFKEWKNYGKYRAYVSVGKKQLGYIDMLSREVCIHNPCKMCKAAVAAYLRAN